jgi:hypothetical protein
MAGKGRPPTDEEQQRMAQRIPPPNDQARTLQETINASKSQNVKGLWHEPERNLGNATPTPYFGSNANRSDNRGNQWVRERVPERVLENERARGAVRAPAPQNQTQANIQHGQARMQSDRQMQDRLYPDAKNILDKDEKLRQSVEDKLNKAKEPEKGQDKQKSPDQSKDRDHER